MRLLRNREVRRGLLLLTGITAALCAVGWAMAGPCCAGLLLVSGAASAAVYLVSARRRYRALADMSQDIDRVRHGIRQLRTPLTAINLTLSMLGREGLPEQERRALLQELRRLVTRMEWLVETLLKMSRIDAGAVSFREESCRAADIIRRAVQPLAVPMELRGITLETAAGEECFTGDAAWSAEALGNVLKNCMEHAASYIRVSARETALFTEITVQDDGPGFRAEDLPRLFERFYRGKDAAPASVGIGLALARMVLSAQNGTIRADNACPGGALFTLRWYRSTV